MSKAKGLELTTAKKRRDVVRASISRVEDRVLGLETKQQLSHSDRLTVQCFSKRNEELPTEFREYHYAVVDRTEQQDSLEEEQAIVEDHEDKIAELVECIQELEVESPLTVHLSTPEAKQPHHLYRWLYKV